MERAGGVGKTALQSGRSTTRVTTAAMAQVAAAQLVALGLRERAVPLGGDAVAGLDQTSPDNSSACPGQLTP